MSTAYIIFIHRAAHLEWRYGRECKLSTSTECLQLTLYSSIVLHILNGDMAGNVSCRHSVHIHGMSTVRDEGVMTSASIRTYMCDACMVEIVHRRMGTLRSVYSHSVAVLSATYVFEQHNRRCEMFC